MEIRPISLIILIPAAPHNALVTTDTENTRPYIRGSELGMVRVCATSHNGCFPDRRSSASKQAPHIRALVRVMILTTEQGKSLAEAKGESLAIASSSQP
jgi:hypothetical protein